METLPRKGDVRRMAALAQMKDEKREMRSFSAAAAFAMSTLYIYVPERFYKVGLEARWGWENCVAFLGCRGTHTKPE